MRSLLDIGPLTETVRIGTSDVDVQGVTPEGFFYLLTKFPQLRMFFGSKDITAEELQAVAPGAIAHALALTTTERGDEPASEWQENIEKAARVAAHLSAHYQMKLLSVALSLTFPDGVGPFMAGVTGLTNAITRTTTGKAPATSSSKRSRSGFVADSPGIRLGRGAPRESSTH